MSLISLFSERGRSHEEIERDNFLERKPESEVLAEFRMSKQKIYALCDVVQADMQPVGHLSTDLTLLNKVQISVKTLAYGSFQNCRKDFMHVSEPTVSRVASDFVNSVVSKASQFIFMPKSASEILGAISDFQAISGLPKVIGAVDGSHIPMIAPSVDEYAYVNQKQFHSINVQAICDANLIFQGVVARWPGSHHDSFILQSSNVYDRIANDEFGDCWLLDDSDYPVKNWLITPFGNPSTAEERIFNVYHRKTRCAIERCFGVLKMRWRILDRKVSYEPAKVCKIALTCCVLHNICRRNGTPFPEDVSLFGQSDDSDENSTSSRPAARVSFNDNVLLKYCVHDRDETLLCMPIMFPILLM